MGMMQAMDATGHTEINWDPENPAEVKLAEEIFNSMKDKGHSLFRIYGEDKKGQRLESFDKYAERILVVPHLVGG